MNKLRPVRHDRLCGIQYLRAMAALMVVYYHMLDRVPALTPALSESRWLDTSLLGDGGVDIFFVISGYIMWSVCRNDTPLRFILRRIFRIVPLYWLLTGLAIAMTILTPTLFHAHSMTARHIEASFLFFPYPKGDYPLVKPGWSLDLEMAFYGLFALALFLPLRYRLWAVGAVLCAATLAGFFVTSPLAKFYTQPLMLEFWLGMVLAHFTRALPRWVSLLCLVGGFAALLEQQHWHALAATAVVAGGSTIKLPSMGWALLLGDASYSIYLTHVFVLNATRPFFENLPAAAFAVSTLACVIVVALLSYQLIERPLMKRLVLRRI
jgi:exopolysaccharide production protein ExoZ